MIFGQCKLMRKSKRKQTSVTSEKVPKILDKAELRINQPIKETPRHLVDLHLLDLELHVVDLMTAADLSDDEVCFDWTMSWMRIRRLQVKNTKLPSWTDTCCRGN
jgi:hypothetical protein